MRAPQQETSYRPHSPVGRRLTQAHVELGRRVGLKAELDGALSEVAARFTKQLATRVNLRSRVLEASFEFSASAGQDDVYAIVSLDGLGTHAIVEIEPSLLTLLFARLSGGGSERTPATCLTRIERAAFGFLCLEALGRLRTSTWIDRELAPRLVSFGVSRAAAASALTETGRWVAVEVALEVDDERGHLRVLIPASPLCRALARVPADVVGPLASELQTARLPAIPRLGRCALPIEELDALRRGDVVVFSDVALCDSRLEGCGRLLIGAFELRGVVQGQAFVVAQPSQGQESPMSKPDDVTSPFTVEVELELARVHFTLGELAQIRPGTVMPLRAPLHAPVTLRIGDRAVATAELVEIDGQVGARILNLFA